MAEDFAEALRERLARNEELARRRAEAEAAFAAAEEREAEDLARREREEQAARAARHAELVDHLQRLVQQLEETTAGSVVARTGWSESREEFVAELSSVQLRPKRTLMVELDRDDDEVLVRWTSDVGRSIEMWRLLEFGPDMLSTLVLQVVDQEAWRGGRPPPFPG